MSGLRGNGVQNREIIQEEIKKEGERETSNGLIELEMWAKIDGRTHYHKWALNTWYCICLRCYKMVDLSIGR